MRILALQTITSTTARYRGKIGSEQTAIRILTAGAALLMVGLAIDCNGAYSPFLRSRKIALYPYDARKPFADAEREKYRGAGVLMCYTDFGTLERAAAAWLVGSRRLVVLNAHNFVDRKLTPSHPIENCFFRINGVDRFFDPDSLIIGADPDSRALHITDDWALLRLIEPVADDIEPQPIPDASFIATGATMKIVMVSPAGHSNTRLQASLEECTIQKVDEATESHIRRARHDCNDGYGGSGSGLFASDGRLIAMHSASLDMNDKRPFDIELHYGSALLFEGGLVEAIKKEVSRESR